MKFTVEIECGNAAFCPANPDRIDRDHEIARILRSVADELTSDSIDDNGASLFDSNGNRVGSARFTE